MIFFSSGTPSGIVTNNFLPINAAIAAKAMPVLPELGSTRFLPSNSPRSCIA